MTTPEQLEKEAAERANRRPAYAGEAWQEAEAALAKALAGWKGTQEAFNLMMDEKVTVSDGNLVRQLEAARALADQLAAELTDKMGGGVDLWMDAELIAAYEARDWK